MNYMILLSLQPPSLDDVNRAIDPILRHGSDNISALYTVDVIDWVITLLYFGILSLLAILGFQRLRLVYQFWRHRHIKPQPKRMFSEVELPRITVQLPLYNEQYVTERLLDSMIKLDYPRHRLDIQVLDDSTDETVNIARSEVEKYRAAGYDIQYIHRTDRTGYKAGALENGMVTAKGELIAIFDADFTPRTNCLRQMVDHFTDESVGMVQMRWSHINADYSLFTRIQQILLDGHLVIEQAARCRTGAFFNFNGTAGMWRREAIEWSGGWQHDTLTEDSDLSFRAQLMGWRFVYLLDEEVPSELPVEINAFKTQQRRWAKGMVQVGLKLLPRVWGHPHLALSRKLELVLRLGGNLASPILILLCLLQMPAMIVRFHQGVMQMLVLDVPLFLFGTLSVMTFYGTAIVYLHPHKKHHLLYLPLVMGLGIGLVFTNTRAVFEALIGIESGFIRTPKYRIESAQDNWIQPARKYRRRRGWVPLLELAFALYFVGAIFYAIHSQIYATIPFLLIFLIGFGYMAMMSLFQGSTQKLINAIRQH